jgi:hypothetical protein
MTKPEAADHHGSHRELLWAPEDPSLPRADIDAIIVPTARHPANLKDAVNLATSLKCALVTLHSGKWTSARETARRFRGKADLHLHAIDVPDTANLGLPDLLTSQLLAGTRFARPADTGPKRNLGLLLSHLVGWKRVVFLDDDIEIHDPEYLRQASALLNIYNVVGLSIGGFPDNSVVCHAYRSVGGDQQSFIGSGALVVQVPRSPSFFPDIYNDDWFYMLDAKKGLQPAATIGEVIQQPYDPFRTPDRARAEEFGDVLAEGSSGYSTRAAPSRRQISATGGTSCPGARCSSSGYSGWSARQVMSRLGTRPAWRRPSRRPAGAWHSSPLSCARRTCRRGRQTGNDGGTTSPASRRSRHSNQRSRRSHGRAVHP